ncbi:MAG: hypothetical protein ABJG15_05445 [Hyphomonadaceae bacterium]
MMWNMCSAQLRLAPDYLPASRREPRGAPNGHDCHLGLAWLQREPCTTPPAALTDQCASNSALIDKDIVFPIPLNQHSEIERPAVATIAIGV